MKENGAPRPNKIPPKSSIDDGQIPVEWRDVNITAIQKKGSWAELGNNRGVSLTSVVGKLLEKIVKIEIDAHIKN